MKNLLAKVVAPFAVMLALGGQPAVAESKSNIHFALGGFSPLNEAVKDFYSGGFAGGSMGVDIRLSDYFRWSSDLSAFTRTEEVDGVERTMNYLQLEPIIQVVGKDNNGILYAGFGPSYNQIQEKATNGKEEAEGTADCWGVVGKIGAEFLSRTSPWGGFAEFSFRNATREDVKFGGTSIVVGAKYFFDK